jgi:membrane protein YdbS with pleckstrin-like domain
MILAMLVRQSVKAVLTGYALCIALAAAIGVYWMMAAPSPDIPWWAPELLPLVLLLFVAMRHIQRRMAKIVVTGGRLRYEAGLASKTTETIELTNVQDVRVEQRVLQRMFNIGDISFETAGKSSRIVMPSIDRPQETASQILDLARSARQSPPAV